MDRYSDTLKRIYNLRGGMIDLRLDRMDRALSLFNHPEARFPSIHIAGTNGKGSTSAMVQRILSLAGYRTGLYTSPHLVSFTERIRVDDQEITSQEVIALTEEIEQRTGAADVPLTFFEFITVMAFVFFARRKIDVAVVEVGLGGRLDATNVLTPLVSAITTIAKDHEAYLGTDVLSIAREKGGIIKEGVPLVGGKLLPEVTELLRGIADDHGSSSYFLAKDYKISLQNEGLFDYTGIKQHFLNLSVGLRGRHQKANAAVALAALELIADRFPTGEQAVREGLDTVHWPGRLEVILDRPTVVLDGAHNGEGVKALIDEIVDMGRGRKVKLLFAAMADKEWDLMVNALANVVDEMVFTRVGMERSADPKRLAESVRNRIPHRVIPDSRTALRTVFDEIQPAEFLVVAGSLYLLGELRPLAQQLVADKLALGRSGALPSS
ncbi:MAG TPA: folylpolyglutamate synthase/dihydrofolate synthase family protein [Terriglobales bacterium]|nr:folylpolyglutamate synthase/dihydrofolate synthase family protein [Terriglobales bacterium]